MTICDEGGRDSVPWSQPYHVLYDFSVLYKLLPSSYQPTNQPTSNSLLHGLVLMLLFFSLFSNQLVMMFFSEALAATFVRFSVALDKRKEVVLMFPSVPMWVRN